MKTKPAPLDLSDAIQLIISKSSLTDGEHIDLKKALARVAMAPLCAKIPQPGFDQSTRDGFAIGDRGTRFDDSTRQYSIDGEIVAGPSEECSLSPGGASRIMTGGLVPVNAIRVIPYEDCQEKDGLLFVPEKPLSTTDTYIHRRGSHIGLGLTVVEAGEVISADHLALLAATGLFSVEVRKKVRVSYFCTGSELLSEGEAPQSGMKISANRYLLDGLINSFSSIADDRGIVGDSPQELSDVMGAIDPGQTDIVISTGGMGPGKYDLLEEAFVKAGGRVLYNALNVRPGKSTLFGLLGSMLFFGLPGPPPAVRVLFNELIRPALLTMQGVKASLPSSIKAVLTEEINLKRGGFLGLKGGRFSFQKGKCTVRLSEKNEPPTCYLLFQPNRRRYREGDSIIIHLTATPFAPCLL